MIKNGGDPIIKSVSLDNPGERGLTMVSLDQTIRQQLQWTGRPLTGINTKTSPESKNFWLEVPQMIVVETRFITEQIATQNNIYSAQTLLPITEINYAPAKKKPTFQRVPAIQKIILPKPKQLDAATSAKPDTREAATTVKPATADAATTVKPDTADIEINTDSINPYRDRAVQTTKIPINTKDVASQCNIEDDLAFEELSATTNNNNNDVLNENKLTEKQEFLIYSREKSIFYLNGLRECMVCGEIEISMDRMLSHLALHWGPSTLCHLCGLKFDHQILMSKHRCKAGKSQVKSKKKRRSHEQCPIFWCGAVCFTRNAFNEHLRQHHTRIQRRRACVTFTLERKMVLIRPRDSKFNPSHRCNICKRFCKNSTSFVKHRKRCVASFIARLKRKYGKQL